jgi:tRNA 2-thiouridine synthesizing protein E
MDLRHWEIIYIVRMFYQEFNMTPSMKMLLSYIKKKIRKEEINSRYLFTLFSHDTLNKISKIAGVPLPTSCL